ncbi:serine carboxypeptidase-like 40 isoform X3 [Syzygium oleosum]|uniref:serine carboxypeptidase-like 40 isoform X3 n=1 Tax=Syzygium oleosum TaxID=219896 RepID=UPI0024BA2AE0|nr:serine carboxypeptidase-like 40 isoform X3 [Syzygium oleosum]
MERNPKARSSLLLFSLRILSSLVHIHGKKQGDALDSLYKAKLEKSGIDTSLFQASDHHESLNSRIYRQEGLKEKDRIKRLPGQPLVEFDHYGGYVTVDESAGRALFYYFAEAGRNKDSMPLLLWLNGGPGCSSLHGAMEELGPFRVHSDGKTLYRNKFAWNIAANVLFLESPAGVGFSYSNTTSDYSANGDRKTAADNYVFLLNWLERFPEYKNRDFYISGESYAGHYVPQLAHNILSNNKKANKTLINLKGIIIGNAAINDETDHKGMYEYFTTHALISQETWYAIQKYCDFSPNVTDQVSQCKSAMADVGNSVSPINIYDIYAPLCFSNLTAYPKKTNIMNLDPCSGIYMHAYLNSEDVQEALHANVTKLDHRWEGCSVVIESWGDSPFTIIPLLQEFMSNGLRVWVFSGDTDGRVPVTSTQRSLSKMSLRTKSPWRPWFLGGEVGGYVQVYEGDLTFVTVRGAGHEVPSYQPKGALSLISHFLAGSLLPSK